MRPSALVVASSRGVKKLNCLSVLTFGEGECCNLGRTQCVLGPFLVEVPNLFTMVRRNETGSLAAELSPNVHLLGDFDPTAYSRFRT